MLFVLLVQSPIAYLDSVVLGHTHVPTHIQFSFTVVVDTSYHTHVCFRFVTDEGPVSLIASATMRHIQYSVDIVFVYIFVDSMLFGNLYIYFAWNGSTEISGMVTKRKFGNVPKMSIT